MFDNVQEAQEYYEETLTQEMENEYYDSYAGNLILLDDDIKSSDWWETDTITLNKVIAKIQEQLKNMYQEANEIENGDYTNTIKDEWDDDLNGVKTDNPDWDEYKDSDDFYDEISFLQEIYWNDFNSNYEDELNELGDFDNVWQLTKKIKEVSNMLADIPEQIEKSKSIVMHETIDLCFEE